MTGAAIGTDPAGSMSRWRARPFDRRNPAGAEHPMGDRKCGNPALTIELEPGHDSCAEATLARAIMVNGLADQVAAAEPHRGLWVSEPQLPMVTQVRTFVTADDETLQIGEPRARRWDARHRRTRIETKLYYARNEPSLTLETDFAVYAVHGGDDDETLDRAAVFLSEGSAISVRELTALLMDALYDAGEYDEARDSFAGHLMRAYPMYEHFAARLIEGADRADLRRVIRLGQQELAWRIGLNDDDGPAEASWTTDGDRTTATITDRKTGRKTSRTMTGADLRRETW